MKTLAALLVALLLVAVSAQFQQFNARFDRPHVSRKNQVYRPFRQQQQQQQQDPLASPRLQKFLQKQQPKQQQQQPLEKNAALYEVDNDNDNKFSTIQEQPVYALTTTRPLLKPVLVRSPLVDDPRVIDVEAEEPVARSAYDRYYRMAMMRAARNVHLDDEYYQ